MNELEILAPPEGSRAITVGELVKHLSYAPPETEVYLGVEGAHLLVQHPLGIILVNLLLEQGPDTGLGPPPPNATMPRDEPPVPVVHGAHGLLGRPQVRVPEKLAEPDPDVVLPPQEGPSLPGLCLRNIASPPGRAECPSNCPGRSRDGGCAADHARACLSDGKNFMFEVDGEGYWNAV